MKYAPITEFLVAQDKARLHLSFSEVEEILGTSLPKSADDYQAWWANDPSHSQAKAWLDVGWRTENLNLSGRTVEFVRNRNAVATRFAVKGDPWGALAGTVTVHDESSLTQPTGESWEADRDSL